MHILTESSLRNEFRDKNLKDLKEYKVEKGIIITPSAKSYLIENKIKLVVGDVTDQAELDDEHTETSNASVDVSSSNTNGLQNTDVTFPEYRYESLQGGVFDTKPEHMTHLYGNKLVNKNNPIIIFRGKVDSFESKILETQIRLDKLGVQKIVVDLIEILNYVKNILKCEMLNELLVEEDLLGMSSDELQEHSHFPQKFYGIEHFSPSYEHGEVVILLNSLRTSARELEIVAYEAFKNQEGVPTRDDIAKGLNRLSSLFYIMMFKVLNGEYV